MADSDFFGSDKFAHFAVCFLVALINPYFAAGLALGKEYGDSKASGNHWCWWDLLADFIGILFGSYIRYIILKSYSYE